MCPPSTDTSEFSFHGCFTMLAPVNCSGCRFLTTFISGRIRNRRSAAVTKALLGSSDPPWCNLIRVFANLLSGPFLSQRLLHPASLARFQIVGGGRWSSGGGDVYKLTLVLVVAPFPCIVSAQIPSARASIKAKPDRHRCAGEHQFRLYNTEDHEVRVPLVSPCRASTSVLI